MSVNSNTATNFVIPCCECQQLRVKLNNFFKGEAVGVVLPFYSSSLFVLALGRVHATLKKIT